ncbi:MAG: hypothetical protein NVS1B4_18370 [Gemmatimonadaceae bacterium]
MDSVDRLFRRLVQNVRAKYPDHLGRPFEAADIYETLVPYRLNRREIGVDSNEDYEIAMLELLSGARGYLVVDDAMRGSLEQELASVNPDPSAFRSFGSSFVSISEDALRTLDESLPAAPQAPAAARGRGHSASAPTGRRGGPGSVTAATAAAAAAAGPRSTSPTPRPTGSRPSGAVLSPGAAHVSSALPAAPRTTTAAAAGGKCRYCAGELPDGRRITFCPHCGQNLTVQHCPACGTELELGWKFCTTCGRGVGA